MRGKTTGALSNALSNFALSSAVKYTMFDSGIAIISRRLRCQIGTLSNRQNLTALTELFQWVALSN